MLVAQPVKRSHVFLGLLTGLILSLSLSIFLALALGFGYSWVVTGQDVTSYLPMILFSVLLCAIFACISFFIALKNEDKIRGIGYALMTWFFLAILYDGLFLLWLLIFKDYPLEQHALVLTFLNPVDLVRIAILLKVDLAAMMGYTGAVFKDTIGGTSGTMMALGALILWLAVPAFLIRRFSGKKDF